MSLRRLLPLILLNILVSAAVVLLILTWWERRQVENVTSAAATVQVTLPVANEGLSPEAPNQTPIPEGTRAVTNQSGGTAYIVQAGDTLGSISAQFDMSMDDIIAANNIDNPDLLSVGQELTIPQGGDVGLVATQSPDESPTDSSPVVEESTPGPAPTEPLEQGLVIVEITEVLGLGSLPEEAIEVANFGDSAVALLGWRLIDAQGHEYTFGQVTLFGEGAAILLHTGAGQDGPTDLYWGLAEAVWESGEAVTLQDKTGVVQASFIIP